MVKKVKRFDGGGVTLSDVLSGNFPAAKKFKEGYAQMPEALKDPMLGLSVGKAGRVLSAGEKAAMEKYATKANKTIPTYTQAEKDALAQQLNANVAKLNPANVTDTGLPSSVGQRLSTQARQPLTGDIGGSGGLSDIGAGPDYKKGGKVKSKKMSSGGNTRGHGCESKGKTKGRFV
jgi:hypothetical protein